MSCIFLWREVGVWVKSLLSGPRPSLASRSSPCPLCRLSYPSKSSPNPRTVSLSPFLIGLKLPVFPSSGSLSLDLPSPHPPPLTLLPAVPPKRCIPGCLWPHPFPMPNSPDFSSTDPAHLKSTPKVLFVSPDSVLCLSSDFSRPWELQVYTFRSGLCSIFTPPLSYSSHFPCLPTPPCPHLTPHFQSPCPIPPAGSGRVLVETGG